MGTVIAQLPGGAVADAETSLGYVTRLLGWDLLGSHLLGDDPETVRKNLTRRAGWGMRAVAVRGGFAANDGAVNEPIGEQLEFLLSDLMHLADALGMDFDGAVNRARNHYAEQTSIHP